MGHLEGITFLDSRGDGHYFISNGKDQTIKLWDIRKMSSNTSWYAYFLASHSTLASFLLFYENRNCLDFLCMSMSRSCSLMEFNLLSI